jgi:hypothetical protein
MQIVRIHFQRSNQIWFESFPAYSIFYWFQFVNEFLDAFEDYDYNKLCEEFKALLIKDDSSSENFSTKINHVLCKFHLDDSSFVLNLISDACAPFIQQDSIANDELDTDHIINLQDEFCLQNEMDPLENFEQTGGVEPIENNFIDKETSHFLQTTSYSIFY